MSQNSLKYLLMLLICVLAGCSTETSNHTPHHQNNHAPEPTEASKTTEPDQPTREMIGLLREACEQVDAQQISYYLNDKRSREIKKALDQAQGGERIRIAVVYAEELLRAGKTQESIDQLEPIVERVKTMDASKDRIMRHQLFRLLAIAYMRKGEQENCLINHTSESCIVPIKGNGVHKLQNGSRSAIELYEMVLSENKDDLLAQWLLNLAYMTLGEYPDKVPQQWLIPPASFESDESIPLFNDVSMSAGVDHTGLSGGVNVDDFNNDGLLDIMASSWGFYDQLKYFVNNGDGTFRDETVAAGLKGVSGGLNTLHADFNNDGFIDLFILRGAWLRAQGRLPNSLIRNNGDGTFTDVTQQAGLLSYFPTQTGVWADFNLDGWIDLFIANESNDSDRFPMELYINNGNGTFTNKAKEAGLEGISGYTKGVAAGDINNDGYPDLYLSNLYSENYLLLNNALKNPGSVSFRDVTRQTGTGQPEKSFPAWFFDYNNDGLEDIFVSGYGAGKSVLAYEVASNYLGQVIGGNPRLYRNDGNLRFTEVSTAMGLNEAIYTMGCNYGDLDNDGFEDFYLTTGNPDYNSIVPNKMFLNKGGKSFSDVTTAGGFGHIQKGHGVGFGDFDNDGDQDIYMVIGGAFEGDVFQNALFENPMGNANNWITIQLEGTTSNRSAIGARIEVSAQFEDGSVQKFHRTVSTGSSFGGNSLQQEIGLGKATIIKELRIKWPNATQNVQSFNELAVNQVIHITEGSGQYRTVEVKRFSFPSGGAHHHHASTP